MEEEKLYPILPGMIRKPNNLEEDSLDVEKLLDKNNQLLKRIEDLEHRVRMLEILIESRHDKQAPGHPYIQQDGPSFNRPQMELTKRSNPSKKYTNLGRMSGL